MKSVTLVATLLNEESSVDYFLDSIESCIPLVTEVILVDSASTDNSVEKIRAHNSYASGKIRVLVVDKCSISAGRNIGIKSAKGDLIVFLDFGCSYKAGFLSGILNKFEKRPNLTHVGGRTQIHPDASELGKQVFEMMYQQDRPGWNMDLFPSARLIAIERPMCLAIPFPLDFSFAGEDTRWAMEIVQVFGEFDYCEQAVAMWMPPNSLWEMREKFFFYGKGDGEGRHFVVRNSIKAVSLLCPLDVLVVAIRRKSLAAFVLRYNARFFSTIGWFYGFWTSFRER